jgi:4'-phosphopantetheinyl transferase
VPEHATPAPRQARTRLSLEAAFEAAASSLQSLDTGCAQVALVDTRDWQTWQEDANALLDGSERMRVSRQRMQRDRDARMLAYAMHRLFLAHVHGCVPAGVPLYRDTGGRPRLIGDAAWTSLSHADGWLAFAVARTGPVGVDVEPAARSTTIQAIAAEICHPDEWRHLSAWPASRRAPALLDTWVRKEAVLKAVGVGLEVPMASFDARDPRSVRVPGYPGCWRIEQLDAGPNAMAAVAVQQGTRVACVRLRPVGAAAAPCALPDNAITG